MIVAVVVIVVVIAPVAVAALVYGNDTVIVGDAVSEQVVLPPITSAA